MFILVVTSIITAIIEIPAKIKTDKQEAAAASQLEAQQQEQSQTDSTTQAALGEFGPVKLTDWTYQQPTAAIMSQPENGRVDTSYFDDALFIGDSLTQGFGIYPPLNEIATVAGFKGIGPKEIVANYEAKLQTGETVATWDYISAQTPHSIYIAVGTNSLVSMPDDAAFMKYYGDMLDALKAQFPGVDIYVQSITPVRAPETRESMSNDRINGLNNQIAQIATAKGMYYLDLHEVLADANGELREDIASSKDGFHMRDAEGYRIWTDYLARHVISSEYNAQFLAEPFNA